MSDCVGTRQRGICRGLNKWLQQKMGHAASSALLGVGAAVLMGAIAWVLFARVYRLERRFNRLHAVVHEEHATIHDVYDIVGIQQRKSAGEDFDEESS